MVHIPPCVTAFKTIIKDSSNSIQEERNTIHLLLRKLILQEAEASLKVKEGRWECGAGAWPSHPLRHLRQMRPLPVVGPVQVNADPDIHTHLLHITREP